MTAQRLLSSSVPGERRMHGLTHPWSFGEGRQVRGPMGALLPMCTGRLVALPELSGDGAPDPAARLSAPAAV